MSSRSSAHHSALGLHWYPLAPGPFVRCQGVLVLVRGQWCSTDIEGLFLCSHGCFLIWFKSLSTEQWGVLWDLARSTSGCYHTKWQVTGRNSRICVCTVTGRMPKALQTQSKGQIFQTLTLHIIIYFRILQRACIPWPVLSESVPDTEYSLQHHTSSKDMVAHNEGGFN